MSRARAGDPGRTGGTGPLRLPTLPDLPVRDALEEITSTLAAHGSAVLVAPPGTGKTTLVPLALAAAAGAAPDGPPGKVVVAEPRRLAARAAATRMATLLGEPVGHSVGYAVRGETRTSAHTRVEVVTTGLLLRRLVADPELTGTAAVVLDECHERHLDADLLLALLLDARDGLRPDLRLLATSATLATERLAELLAGPVVEVVARTFPVTVEHRPPARGERIEACVARAVRATLAAGDGDVLAFLPGVAEIRRTAAALSGLDVEVLPLHGRLPTAEQDRVLQGPGDRRRVVLATAVAESSLTVPGVRAVVDSGLARVPRTDHRRGLAGLVTVRVSAAVATQRAGRAGREAPGRVLRCWPDATLLRSAPEPEIQTADLTRLALDLACWGTPDGRALRWWDAPPPGPLRAGQAVLHALGAVSAVDPSAGTGPVGAGPVGTGQMGTGQMGTGQVTERGRRMAELGLHPRLARALLDGAELAGDRLTAEVVALLDDDTLAAGAEVSAELRRLRSGAAPGARRWRAEVARLGRLLGGLPGRRRDGRHRGGRAGAPRDGRDSAPPSDRDGAGDRSTAEALVVALAHPERLARRRAPGSRRYLLAGGTAVELAAGTGLDDQEWLAVAVADRTPGADHGRVRLAAAADRALAVRAAPALLAETDEVSWVRGDPNGVVARHRRQLGAITLDERALTPDPAARRAALRDGLRVEGLGLLRWPDGARRLRDRLTTLHRALGEPWPDVSDAALLADSDRWWSGRFQSARGRGDLARIDATDVLRAVLDWRAAATLDELAPERLTVPSGSRIAVDYSGERPVLAVRVQEVLGWTDAPAVAGGRLPVQLHLLSPAGRPAAVTDDLASFWTTGYPQVRSELRGRYPKHAWPTDPRTATPTRRTRTP